MAREYDPYKLSSPQVYLWRIGMFLVIVAFVVAILWAQIRSAFMANPGLNGLIVGVLAIGIVLSLRQVVRLFPEISWVNSFRLGDPGLEVRASPTLLAPMASLLGDRVARASLTPETMRSILDSIGMRLDESRDILRYLAGLLVFLGLLGTFWGLQGTVSAVGSIIQSLEVGTGDMGVMFDDLKAGLAAPLGGMGTAFSSSLFGLAGSLILGFLDLQASQAQNRFYTELEDWLSTLTEIAPDLGDPSRARAPTDMADLRGSIERLGKIVSDAPATAALSGAQGRAATAAMADLAEGIQGLVQHMRSEQQMIREWVEAQAEQQKEVRRLLETIAAEKTKVGS